MIAALRKLSLLDSKSEPGRRVIHTVRLQQRRLGADAAPLESAERGIHTFLLPGPPLLRRWPELPDEPP